MKFRKILETIYNILKLPNRKQKKEVEFIKPQKPQKPHKDVFSTSSIYQLQGKLPAKRHYIKGFYALIVFILLKRVVFFVHFL